MSGFHTHTNTHTHTHTHDMFLIHRWLSIINEEHQTPLNDPPNCWVYGVFCLILFVGCCFGFFGGFRLCVVVFLGG